QSLTDERRGRGVLRLDCDAARDIPSATVSDRDRPKKSWREIDAGRDRAGGSARTPGGPRPGPSADRSSKQYRAALDALFEKGEVGKLAEKLSAPPPRSTPTPPAA